MALNSSGKPKLAKGMVLMNPIAGHIDYGRKYKDLYRSYHNLSEMTPSITTEIMFGKHISPPQLASPSLHFLTLCPEAGIGATTNDLKQFAISSANHAQFPPAYIVTCSMDPFRDDGTVLTAALKDKRRSGQSRQL
jgi:versiconal hemiacetal acetate esterase